MASENFARADGGEPSTRADIQLVSRVIAGDDSAFDELIVKYYSELLTYLAYAVNSRELGEDLLQELFLQIWKKRENLPTDGNLRPYLYAAARHRIFDHRRTQRRADHWTEEYLDAVSEQTQLEWSDPLTTLENTELESAVRSAIDLLPERAREVWRLHREQGLTYHEIAEVLAISINTVKTHMTRSAIAIQIPMLLEKSRLEAGTYSQKPVDVGRYDVVFDAASMASLLAETIGPATQLDRAVGYEANAGGTSFLNEPLEMLGTRMIAAPSINIVADRTMPRGLATVQWDDEGVSAGSFPIVEDGRFVDFQTTREQATWLTPYYERIGKSIVSRGCATSTSALHLPMQHTPNLTLKAGPEDIGFDQLVAGVKRGLAIQGMQVTTDFQVRQGNGSNAVIREIVDGRLGAYIMGAGVLFNTDEIWKNIKALGGSNSVMSFEFLSQKGEPVQRASFTGRSVPALITNVSIIDVKRKA